MTTRAGSWIARALLRVLFAAIVVAAVGFLLCLPLHGVSRKTKARLEDTNTLRNLVEPVARTGTLPMKDGAFDPYRFVRREHIPAHFVRSERAGMGPTDEEIEDGDYANFGWERYRGEGKLEGPPFPLLWDRKPDDDGRILVAYSDGTVVYREAR
ncbi:MAG: hypothetical protein L6Q95_07790 [Planctomycetes bacterium]|nr:hypothetical protein [Planctomycetota bacterium]